ncbi:MAG TPA: ATP-dependent sacrificial sulfur transferase LarE [Methanothrix sp.]|nr:ATP-dependent sacrificial sulfur transferase LarE [Methanothrix sp.]HRW83068.1 ATP-dependent sacrificial sulfur transferase LarE [Methanothrix sp.]
MTSFEELCRWFCGLDGVVVAFSGGVDSSVLAAAARSALGDGALAATVKSELESGRDLSNARKVAAEIGIEHAILEVGVLGLDGVRMNLQSRCRLCKRAMAEQLLSFARSRGIEVVVDGTNASDREEDRPGIMSLLEAGVRMPLRDLGVTKDAAREMARGLGLSSADRPSRSCLAPRIEGPISPERLRKVEAAEELLPLGWKVSDRGDTIGVLVPEGERLSNDAIAGLKRLGYRDVVIEGGLTK